MKTKTFLFILVIFYWLSPIVGQNKEIIGYVKKETIGKNEVIVFITQDKKKLEVVGKLTSFIKSFYLNQKLKVSGIITIKPNEAMPNLDGKIEIKEIIITLQ